MARMVCAVLLAVASIATADQPDAVLQEITLNSRFYAPAASVDGCVLLDAAKAQPDTAVVCRWLDGDGRVRAQTDPYRLDRREDIGQGVAFAIPLIDPTTTVNRIEAAILSTIDGRQLEHMSVPLAITPQDPRWGDYQVMAAMPSLNADAVRAMGRFGVQVMAARRFDDVGHVIDAGARLFVDDLLDFVLRAYPDQADWQKVVDRYRDSRGDPAGLIRRLGLGDPTVLVRAASVVEQAARLRWCYTPVWYNLAHQPGIGYRGAALDLGFGPDTLVRFRDYLKLSYRTIDALNEQWQTRCDSWQDVQPMTLDRTAVRTAGPLNLSPWADHRAFMDDVFAGVLSRMRDVVRQIDAEAPVGISGVGIPSPYGYDYWKLTRAVDVFEYEDSGCARELLGSLRLPRHRFTLSLDDTRPWASWRVWRQWLAGDHGVVLRGDVGTSDLLDADLKLTADGRRLAAVLAALRGGLGGLFFHAEPPNPVVAIVHNQASTRAAWFLELAPHGLDWPKAGASMASSLNARNREGWCKLFEDLHWPYRFIDVAQIETSILDYLDCKVVVLPQMYAVSPETADAIRRFVRRGGLVIADVPPAVMDAHGRTLESGQLNDVFGVRSGPITWPPRDMHIDMPENRTLVSLSPRSLTGHVAQTDMAIDTGHVVARIDGIPCVVVNKVDAGWAVLLNVLACDYPAQRVGTDQGQPLRTLLTELAQGLVGVHAPLAVKPAGDQPVWPVKLTVWRSGAVAYLGLMNNPSADTVPGDGERLLVERRVTVDLTVQAHVYDVRAGQYLGHMRNVEVTVPAAEPVLLAALPYKVDELKLGAGESVKQGQTLSVQIQLTGTPRVIGHHVLRVALTAPDGHVVDFVSPTVLAKRGRHMLEIPIALNDPVGRWQLKVTDMLTGLAAVQTVVVTPRPRLEFPKSIDVRGLQ